ncbi:hypothetical protein CWM66_02245 [Kosakonia sp. H7A]|nr:hypothetical protein CWM66_02245 [Kosakonia sp. H7A]
MTNAIKINSLFISHISIFLSLTFKLWYRILCHGSHDNLVEHTLHSEAKNTILSSASFHRNIDSIRGCVVAMSFTPPFFEALMRADLPEMCSAKETAA